VDIFAGESTRLKRVMPSLQKRGAGRDVEGIFPKRASAADTENRLRIGKETEKFDDAGEEAEYGGARPSAICGLWAARVCKGTRLPEGRRYPPKVFRVMVEEGTWSCREEKSPQLGRNRQA